MEVYFVHLPINISFEGKAPYARVKLNPLLSNYNLDNIVGLTKYQLNTVSHEENADDFVCLVPALQLKDAHTLHRVNFDYQR